MAGVTDRGDKKTPLARSGGTACTRENGPARRAGPRAHAALAGRQRPVDIVQAAYRRDPMIDVRRQSWIFSGTECPAAASEADVGAEHPVTRIDAHRSGTITEIHPVQVRHLAPVDHQ